MFWFLLIVFGLGVVTGVSLAGVFRVKTRRVNPLLERNRR